MNAAVTALTTGVLALLSFGGSEAAECVGTPSSAALHFTVQNVRSTQGHMTGTIYRDDPVTFLKKAGALKVWSVAVTLPTTDMCVWLPGPGLYALAVYQDLNDNGAFDHPGLGSIEPFGFSRNPTFLIPLPPDLASTRFKAGEGDTVLRIRLNYR